VGRRRRIARAPACPAPVLLLRVEQAIENDRLTYEQKILTRLNDGVGRGSVDVCGPSADRSGEGSLKKGLSPFKTIRSSLLGKKMRL